MRVIQVLSAVLLSALICQAEASCRFEKKISHVFKASDFKLLKVNALAGRLDVNGTSGDAIVFEGTACASDKKSLEKIDLDVDDSGDELELTVVIPFRDFGFDPEYAYVDVEVSVPRDLPTSLRDSSGDILARDITLTSVDDSSGSIRINESRGNLSISDSSGDIDVRDLTGNLEIQDSSGEITVRNVQGDVIIPRDSSGDIEIEKVSGKVVVERDGSGSIEIEEVAMSVNVESDGSGDIDISEVKGDVMIGRDGSGRVSVTNVDGNFELAAKGDGDVRVRDVKGKVSTPR